MNRTVFLNGKYMPESEAKVSIFDRGFLMADAVYEVVSVLDGKLLEFSGHLKRLERSLGELDMAKPKDFDNLLEIHRELVARNNVREGGVYLQITRGVADKRDHSFPLSCTPTIFAMCNPIMPVPGEQGVQAITLDDVRWQLCHIKATTLLANILLRQKAIDEGSVEAILIKAGYATEGAASNIFVVIDGVLITPPKTNEILPGITRDVIIHLAKTNHIPVAEDVISLEALQQANEIWLTSSTREILPVTILDHEPIGNGQVGPVWQAMNGLFQEYKQVVV